MAPVQKLHGRAFYESIGSPKYIVAPMVDQSEFAWRLLTRSFLPPDLRTSVLAYSPMLHAKLFSEKAKYREDHFLPRKGWGGGEEKKKKGEEKRAEGNEVGGEEDTEGKWHLDGNPNTDRPLFVQFCANEPDTFLAAAKLVQPYCDAVDLNLGCPQGIAKRGHYGAFLQEDWDLIYKLINTLHKHLDIPVTAKFRIQETREKTLEYAKMILSAGASVLTVHGRSREQKGHYTGLADWGVIRYLREQLPRETVMFANGNVLQYGDVQRCLDATGVDGVMSAEGNLYDPSIFAAPPPLGEEGREYWRGKNGKGGYRMDAVLRRYMDILYKHVLGQEPPAREPLFLVSDRPELSNQTSTLPYSTEEAVNDDGDAHQPPPNKKQRRNDPPPPSSSASKKGKRVTDTNLTAMQAHLFHLLRALVSKHTNVRDALARCKAGDMPAYENVLSLVEDATKQGMLEYAINPALYDEPEDVAEGEGDGEGEEGSSDAAVRRCGRPFWVCQSHVRPLPKEAIEKGSIQLSKKEKARLLEQERETKESGLVPGGRVEREGVRGDGDEGEGKGEVGVEVEVPREGVVCG